MYEGEVFRAFRFPAKPRKALVLMHALLHKHLFIEGGRMLGRKTPDGGFETVLGFVNEDSVRRVFENVRNNPKIDLEKWAVESGPESAAKLQPIGFFFTQQENELMSAIFASDPEAVECYHRGIADRMDREGPNDDGRFVFPDLTEEEYNRVRAIQNQKTN